MQVSLKSVSTALGIAAVIAAVTLWPPSVAQTAVDRQAETQEKSDKVQTDDIAELRKQVVTLTTAQAVTNTNLTNLTEAVAASTEKDDELKLEIKQLIKAIE